MQLTVKVVEIDGQRKVMLPTYTMIGDIGKDNTVTVQVPDDECTDGKLDEAKIRAKYKKNPLWDKEGILKEVEP